MIIDGKSTDGLVSAASTSERKLSVELPNSRQIYTTGSDVKGIVHLGAKDLERPLEVKVSLVCVVHSMHHRYYGGNPRDDQVERTKLIHRDHVLWSSSSEGCSPPPADFPFIITIPNVGNDTRAKNPNAGLPPSFEPGPRRGLRRGGIGYVKYYVKVVVTKKGAFTRNSNARQPFIFFPTSPPPPLLPDLPTSTLNDLMYLPEDSWEDHTTAVNLRQNVFNKNGKAELRLWLPRVPYFPRLTGIPFLLCFTITTQATTGAVVGLPPQEFLPPAAQTAKATLILRKNIHACAKRGKQKHELNLDAEPTDNLLYSLVPEESEWTPKTFHESESGTEKGCWEKRYLWRGMWTCKETPSFVNRQITCKYALVAEVPIKGLGNGMKVATSPIEITSGVAEGTDPSLNVEAYEDFPPAYFELDDDDDDYNSEDEKPRDHKG